MKNNFRLEDFKNGLPAMKANGQPVKFIAILKNVPAPLLIDVDGEMQNYHLDGSFMTTPTDEDLEMMELPLTAIQHKQVYG